MEENDMMASSVLLPSSLEISKRLLKAHPYAQRRQKSSAFFTEDIPHCFLKFAESYGRKLSKPLKQ